MSFRTSIVPDKPAFWVNHGHSIILFGSCFSANMGEKLCQSGFKVLINPYGVLYNPISIANALGRIVDNIPYTADEMIHRRDLWLSIDHHGTYAKSDQAEALQGINEEIAVAHHYMHQNPLLVITLGSAQIYKYLETNRVAGNCHKLPSREFSKEMLTVDEIVDALTACFIRLFEENQQVKVILTISPVRYLSDGFFENQLSKSILHLSVAALMSKFSQVRYFPAYEIMMDDLRDYRFYAEDMLHPSPLAVDYIWSCFKTSCFSAETQALADEVIELHKALAHRPFRPKSLTYRAFLNNQIRKIDQLQKLNGHLDLSNLLSRFETKMKELD